MTTLHFQLIMPLYKEIVIMLELYYSPTCPYCQKVLSACNDLGIDLVLKDVSIKKNFDELISLGKFAQVPFLVDTDKNTRMYESDVIIDYVKSLK